MSIIMVPNQKSESYTVSAPGKVILFGEHSVVYQKAAVSTSIGRRLYVMNKLISGNYVTLKLPQIDADLSCNIECLSRIIDDKYPVFMETSNNDYWHVFHEPTLIDHNIFFESLKTNLESFGVEVKTLPTKTLAAFLGFLFLLRGMCYSLGSRLVPLSMEVRSDIEIGAGTGSSAAFSVALAGSVFQLRKRIDTQENIKSLISHSVRDSVVINNFSEKSGFTVDEARIINKWAFCVEKLMHGHPSGIDNTTCTFGSVVVTSQEVSQPGKLSFRFLENVPKISILLVSTGVSRNTASLVVKVKTLREGNPATVDAILTAMGVIAQEASKTLIALGKSTSDPTITKEYFRVLNDLIELNHGLLRTLGVSHESLEKIVEVSKRYGLCSKLTGAGGGGYAITLVPPSVSVENVEKLKRELGASFQVTEINIAEDGIRLEK